MKHKNKPTVSGSIAVAILSAMHGKEIINHFGMMILAGMSNEQMIASSKSLYEMHKRGKEGESMVESAINELRVSVPNWVKEMKKKANANIVEWEAGKKDSKKPGNSDVERAEAKATKEEEDRKAKQPRTIDPAGFVRVVDPPKNGTDYTLDELHKLIESEENKGDVTITLVSLRKTGEVMVCEDNAIALNMKENKKATKLASGNCLIDDGGIRGTVFVCPEDMVK